MNEKCPYYGECGIVNNCDIHESCRVKEWIDDFYKIEKMYFNISEQSKKMKEVLKYINKISKNIDTTLDCPYGDYNCINCSDLEEPDVCNIKLKNTLLEITKEYID